MLGRSRRTGAWSGRLTPREEQLSKVIIDEIEVRGPLGSDYFDDSRRGRKVWGLDYVGEVDFAETVLSRKDFDQSA